MNSDLTKRLNDLKKDIIHPEGMQVTQSQNYPFSIFVYSPEEEFIMRAKFQELILDIKKKDIQILEINLAHECIELAKNRVDDWSIEEIIQREKDFLKTIKTLTIHFNL
ncbi:MAG: hypothetical protein IPH52_28490 [Leptospiraceae bacterium]|nr:hypothetical protein [Leptospiraceae bacterium]